MIDGTVGSEKKTCLKPDLPTLKRSVCVTLNAQLIQKKYSCIFHKIILKKELYSGKLHGVWLTVRLRECFYSEGS